MDLSLLLSHIDIVQKLANLGAGGALEATLGSCLWVCLG